MATGPWLAPAHSSSAAAEHGEHLDGFLAASVSSRTTGSSNGLRYVWNVVCTVSPMRGGSLLDLASDQFSGLGFFLTIPFAVHTAL